VLLIFLFCFLCCPVMCLYVLSLMLWCPLRFPHITYAGAKIGKNMIFWRKIVIFHTKYPKNFRFPSPRRHFFKSPPPLTWNPGSAPVMFGSSLPSVVRKRSDLHYLCLFRIVVSKTYCVVSLFCLSSSCVLYTPMLSVSLDCPFLIALLVFSLFCNVCFHLAN
jgi:hypothetical protein